MIRNAEITILVNTSDSFEDCWDPFFTLFARYWPNCSYPIVLNTESKDYSFEGLNIVCSKVALGENRRLTWSECLARALDGIKSPYILYLQEDYFLESGVREDALNLMLDFVRGGQADVIRLSEAKDAGPWLVKEDAIAWKVSRRAKYQISLQAALWRKDFLRAQIRLHETPWQLESYGSKRLKRQKTKIYCVNRGQFSGDGKEIIPYKPTGVIAGKWVRQVVEPLFALNNIEVNFNVRGFYDKSMRKKRRNLLLRLKDFAKSFF